MEKTINMADVCALAHALTERECWGLGITELEVIDDNGDTQYPDNVQLVFDQYRDLITETLNF